MYLLLVIKFDRQIFSSLVFYLGCSFTAKALLKNGHSSVLTAS